MLLATSLNVFTEVDVPIEEQLDRCAAAGFEAVDFNLIDYRPEQLGRMTQGQHPWGYARSLRSHAERVGLRWVQAHAPGYGVPSAVDPDGRLAYCRHCLEWAAALGVEWMVFHPLSHANGGHDATHLEGQKRANMRLFEDLLETAAPLGVGIAIENMADVFASENGRRVYCATPAELIDLVDALDHPLVGICWDVGHAHLQRLDQRQALRAVGPRLKATHIQDNDGASDQHLLPYRGGIDWPVVMAALREIGYAGAFCYEAHNAIRVLPDELRDGALRHAAELGRYLLGLA
jgi:sugar phosphate isomerase/epimerase